MSKKTKDLSLADKMARDGYTAENLPNIAPEELMARYGLSREEAEAIIEAAKPKSAKVRRIQEANEGSA